MHDQLLEQTFFENNISISSSFVAALWHLVREQNMRSKNRWRNSH